MTNRPDYICPICSGPIKPSKTHWCPSWETGEKMRQERETVISDLEARLLAWMKPCLADHGTKWVHGNLGKDDWGEEYVTCASVGCAGQEPVLLGVTVERCPGCYACQGMRSDIRFHPPGTCGGSGYAWQRQDAVEKLQDWALTSFHAILLLPHEVRIIIEANAEGIEEAHYGFGEPVYEALLQAVDALREEEAKP